MSIRDRIKSKEEIKMLFNTLKEIKEELTSKSVNCKIKNHQKTLAVEGKNYSFLVDKRDNSRFDVSVFENVDYELVETFYNISGFEATKKIKNLI